MKFISKFGAIVTTVITLFFLACDSDTNTVGEWREYLGGTDRNHFSPLYQIDTNNVGALKVAWTYHTLDSGELQCSPIVVGETLFGVTPYNHLFAINASTGKELWRFKPDTLKVPNVNRGVAYWKYGEDERILYAYQSWLYAVNAKNGEPIKSFGTAGRTSLKSGLGRNAHDKFVASTTPGTIYKNMIIMPIRVGEGEGAAPGYVQAFDILTGKVAWVFRTIPQQGEKGYNTWSANINPTAAVGGANNWAGMSLDEKRGVVYVPTGSAAFDFYGGNRKGENLFANCILALNAENGKYIWHYQVVHHDIWDRDLPAPPNLVSIIVNGRKIDVVAQVTKTGHVFVLDRDTGKPVFLVDEVPVPGSVLHDEEAWPTQPVPRLPLPFARQSLTRNDITPFSAKRDSLSAILKNSNHGNFQPLQFSNTVLLPGADGGAEWGGAGVTPEGIMYVNSNEMPWLFSLSLKEKRLKGAEQTGGALFNKNCAVCHGTNLKGNPASGYPSLQTLNSRLKKQDVLNILKTGRGMMPGFTSLTNAQKDAIVNYLWGQEKKEIVDDRSGFDTLSNIPYVFNGYNKFLDENGLPAITPPWGTLTAIDLNSGKHIWRIPLGEVDSLSKAGIAPTGTENYGGPLLTSGGLLFIAATKDGKFRAFNNKTGKLLWEYRLAAPGFATPITYTIKGVQYIVIACGGTKLGTNTGDSYVAFKIP